LVSGSSHWIITSNQYFFNSQELIGKNICWEIGDKGNG